MTATAIAPLTLAQLDKRPWQWRGHQIYHTIHGQGSGQPLVLIHGFGASIGHWRKNIPALVVAGYEVHALDLLGFGASDKPAIVYSLELWADLLQDYWQAHIARPAVFIGNSIGGLLTLIMLAQSPQMAKAGVLLNCAGGLNHRPEELPPPLRFVMGSFTRLVSSPLVGPFIFNQVRQKFRIRGSLRQVYRNRAAITEELVDMIHQPACDPGAQRVFAAIVSAPPGPRPQDLLPQVEQPLLVLWGENDPWTPIQGATLYQERAQDPHALVTFQAIADTGHCPHDERPEVVNPALLTWLETVHRHP